MLSVAKQHKRLVILNEAGEVVYTPPDFMRHRMQSRQPMIDLAARLSTGAVYIREVMAFETAFHPNNACRRPCARVTARSGTHINKPS